MPSRSDHPVRRTVAAAVIATALLTATACRTSPGAAAYVGDRVITTSRLERAVQDGLADRAIADVYSGRLTEYRKTVLQSLINTEVYDAAAEQFGAAVSAAEVSTRLDQIVSQTGDPGGFYAQQAAQGRTEADVRELVRQLVLGEAIADAAGLSEGNTEAALRTLYEESRGQYAQYDVGLVTVADQPTADSVLAQLTADPDSYPQLAAAYPGDNTLPTLQTATAEQLGGIVSDLSTLAPGQGRTDSLLQTGEITVIFIGAISYPSFEDLRPTLQQQAEQDARAAVQTQLQSVRDSLDIAVNPRYGSLDESGTLVPDDRGVVTVTGVEPTGDPTLN